MDSTGTSNPIGVLKKTGKCSNETSTEKICVIENIFQDLGRYILYELLSSRDHGYVNARITPYSAKE